MLDSMESHGYGLLFKDFTDFINNYTDIEEDAFSKDFANWAMA